VTLHRELVPPAPGRPAIEIVDTGPLLTVQDAGRLGWAHVGVPVAGAADSGAARAANRLEGNPAEAAVLEATSGACRIRLRAACLVAVTGGHADITVDGLPARPDSALPLRAGSELVIGPCRSGLRVYLALAGGVEPPRCWAAARPTPCRGWDRLPSGPGTGWPSARRGPAGRKRSLPHFGVGPPPPGGCPGRRGPPFSSRPAGARATTGSAEPDGR
jgi:Carboxyltransferase domain, subdomain A and B